MSSELTIVNTIVETIVREAIHRTLKPEHVQIAASRLLRHLALLLNQISRGRFDRLQCTTAGFTTSALDGYGLRRRLPLRPPP
jgi:hypothetical protein